MKEIFVERDIVLKEFVNVWNSGVEIGQSLQDDFLKYTRQISARKCLKMGACGEDLDDMVSDACLSFFQAVSNKQFIVTDNPIAAYVSKVTRNVVLNRSEKQNSKNNWVGKQIEEMKLPRTKRPVEEEVINRESIRKIGESIDILSKRQKEAILLVAEGFTHKEICNNLKITEYELNSRIYRARIKIKSSLL